MSEFVLVGKKDKFPSGRTTGVVVDGTEVCIARIENEFYAFDDTCSHQKAALSGCSISNQEVTCPLHGAKFSVINGAAKSLPAVTPLKMHEVKCDGDEISIRLNK